MMFQLLAEFPAGLNVHHKLAPTTGARWAFYRLDPAQRRRTATILRHFIALDNWLMAHKLVHNALAYASGEDTIRRVSDGEYVCHSNHIRTICFWPPDNRVTYTCELFSGMSPYSDLTGMCSHVMAPWIVYGNELPDSQVTKAWRLRS
ncbi:MAG TPA: hypothetical protein VI322_04965 [Candidatus Saccharimonadia bacterium]